MKCEICGKEAKSICPRCYRYICSECTDPITLYCVDCSSFKRWQEEDYLRYIEILEKKIRYLSERFENEKCAMCLLYKDSIMSCLRKVKELEALTKLENFEKAYEKVIELKDVIQDLAIKYTIKYIKKI